MAAGGRGTVTLRRVTAGEKVQRLLALIPWVEAHHGPTIDEVCARFAISERELLGDLSLVSMVGLPPYSPDELFDAVVEDGRVWVHLSPSFRRPLRLTPAQGLGLIAAGASALAAPGADPDGPLARGLAKLQRVLGVAPDEAVDVDLGDVPRATLALVEAAIGGHRAIELDYYTFGRDERTRRVVEPHGVFNDQGAWYLVAFDRLRDDERVFRLERIVEARLLDDRFEPPSEQPALAVYQPRPDDPRVELELGPEAAWVTEQYPVESVVPGDDGRLRVTLSISARPWLERLLLRLGPHARVLGGDPSLASAGSDAARRILARYGEGRGRRPEVSPDPVPSPPT